MSHFYLSGGALGVESTIYQTHEGSLTLEGEWLDHSINMLASLDLSVAGSNLVMSREVLPPGVSPEDYMDQQKLILKKELHDLKEIADTKVTVDSIPARFLEISWNNHGTPMDQMLMVIHREGQILTLTATIPGGANETTREALLAAMQSFRFSRPQIEDPA